jgi:hypothetical protein
MFTVTIEAFDAGGTIPGVFTCEGENLSPALSWAGEPEGTQSFALIMDDPDAPAGTWNHWLLWDIPTNVHALPQQYRATRPVHSGTNDFGEASYGGPCPPKAMAPIATSFGFTRLTHRPWASLEALAERNWSVPFEGTGSA